MRTFRRLISALLIGTFCLPNPTYALRPEPDRAGVEEALHPAAGMEEKQGPSGWAYDPEDVAMRLMRALLGLESIGTERFFDSVTGRVTLNYTEAARLLKNVPDSGTFGHVRNDFTRLADEVNEKLSHPETAPLRLEKLWRKLFARGIYGIQIKKRNESDRSPKSEGRLTRAVRNAQKAKLSFRPKLVKGPQTETPPGKELKRAFIQITQGKRFPKYVGSWPNFLLSRGVSLQEAYGESEPRRRNSLFAVYTDLERDETGFPILDERRRVGTFRITRLDALWKKKSVRRAQTVFLVGIGAKSDMERTISFNYRGKDHSVHIPFEGFDPDHPVFLVLEISPADPYHAVQVARRMDTRKVVYPFAGQMLFYVKPPFKDGQVQEGAFLFRAYSNVTPAFLAELAELGETEIYATRVRTVGRSFSGENRPAAYFHVGAELLKATRLTFNPKAPQLLTARLDPAARRSLEAWDMADGQRVFSREDARPSKTYQLCRTCGDPAKNSGCEKCSLSPVLA